MSWLIAMVASIGLALPANALGSDTGPAVPVCQGSGCESPRPSEGAKPSREKGSEGSRPTKESASPLPAAKAERTKTLQTRHPRKPCEEVRPCPID